MEKFTLESIAKDKAREWEQARVFHGGKFRELRYKEVKKVLWQGGDLLRLIVVAPVLYRTTQGGRAYYRLSRESLSFVHRLSAPT
jgi:hypothetical protein